MPKNQKKIMITGGAGFIGSNFVRYIYNKYPDYIIYNFDFLTYAGNSDNLKDIEALEKKSKSRRYFFVRGDICDQVLVGSLFKKHRFNYIVNFAAESHVDRSIDSDYHFIRSNLLGVYNLINMAREHNQPRFVHISTDEIYGDATDNTEDKFSHERSPMRPSNPYAASKAAADLLVQSYMRTHKTPSLIVRGSNNFGPYQYPEKLVPLAITNLLEGKDVPVHGDGQQTRMWIHVEDFCSGIDLAMHKGKDFAIYNVSGLEVKNLDIVRNIIKILGLNAKKHIRFVGNRPGGDMRYAPYAGKIKKELGWELRYPVDEYLTKVVAWYAENTSWWKKVKKKKDFKVHYKKQYKSEFW